VKAAFFFAAPASSAGGWSPAPSSPSAGLISDLGVSEAT